jgi:hypothetical protein
MDSEQYAPELRGKLILFNKKYTDTCTPRATLKNESSKARALFEYSQSSIEMQDLFTERMNLLSKCSNKKLHAGKTLHKHDVNDECGMGIEIHRSTMLRQANHKCPMRICRFHT